MKYPNYKYIAFAKNKKRRRQVILIDDLDIPNGSNDIFTSYLRYPIEFQEYWRQNNHSVAGYEGRCYSDLLPIDLDSKNLNDAQVECQHLISLLVDQYEVNPDCLGIFFSGSKGFHIEIPTVLFGDIQVSPNLPYIFKAIPKILDVKYHDTTIYNRNAIWRAPNTINSKSGLYKIPLSFNQINTLSIKKIQLLAKEAIIPFVPINYEDWNEVPELATIWAQAEKSINIGGQPAKEYLFREKGENRRLSHGGVSEGYRNTRAFEIAKELKTKGYKINEAKEYLVKDWNPKNNPPEKNIKSIFSTVESVYKYSIKDSGSVEVFKHLRNDPYYNSLKPIHKAIYIDIICHMNEISKIVWSRFTCNVNQLIFSYDSIAQRVGATVHQVRTVIYKLKKWGRITVEVLKDDDRVVCSRLTFMCFEEQAKAQTDSRRDINN